jgi:hypothetical protein
MDIDQYLYERIQSLSNKSHTKKDNAIIKGLCGNFNIPPDLNILRKTIPMDWIEQSNEYGTDEITSLVRYSTDEGMDILRLLHEDKQLTDQQQTLLDDIIKTLNSDDIPRPDKDFLVFRGIRSCDKKLGDTIISNGPSSATFSFQIAQDYTGVPCCMAEIVIPKGSIVTYVNMLDQILFPPMSSFQVIGEPHKKTWYIEELCEFTECNTIQLRLIN